MFYILFNGYHRLLMINLMETPNETVKSTGEKKRKKKKKKTAGVQEMMDGWMPSGHLYLVNVAAYDHPW